MSADGPETPMGKANARTEPQTLRGSEILVLDDPGSMWLVEKGTVGVFSVALRGRQPCGPRRHHFSPPPGEALFGLPPVEEDGRPGVIAVAFQDTTLRRVAPEDLAAALQGSGRRHEELVARWVESWERSVGPVGPSEGAAAAGLPRSWETLGPFHEALLVRIREVALRERRDDLQRLASREQLSREATGQAVAELTSVLEPGREPLPRGTALFVAASAAARALGIALRSPAAWEEGLGRAEPVEMIARASHVRVRRVLLHDGWWDEECGPLLGFRREGGAPVALLPRAPGRYRMFDPATGTLAAVDRGVAETLDPQAYVFYRPLPGEATRALELLRFALAGRGRDLLMIGLTAVGATILGMLTPQATALLVDHAIPDANRDLLLQIGLGLVAAAFGSAAFRLAQGIALMRLETGADVAMQAAAWDRLLNLQLSFFRRFSTGDLQSRVTAVSQIRSHLGGTTLRSLFSSVILLLNLGLLLYYSVPLALVAVAVAALSCAVTVVSGAMVLRCSRLVWELRGRFFGLMVQLIHGVSKLRVAAAEERAFARWAREYAQLLKLELRQGRIQDTVRVINIGVSTLSAILLFAAAASLIEAGSSLTTGLFLAFNAAYGTFIGAIASLSNTATEILAVSILRERVRPILEAAPEIHERKADPGRLRGRIVLDHVVFQYHPQGPIILDEVSLRIEPGQFIALVGPSGSGKSTLFRLLLSFESPRSGTIYYDGQDLSGLDVHAVRRQMGVVLQNGRINAGSLFDNIVCGAQASLNDAWEAARAAGFADEIAAMPMGMHTVVSEGGTNLSGGQRQRLLLTRALVHRPSILLLDEATSALDNKTQAIVMDSLKRLRVTRVVIAHRLSTVRGADRIYVVDGGRIVESGVFDELVAQNGLFARMMTRQLA